MPSAGFFDEIPSSAICTYYYIFFLLDVAVFAIAAVYMIFLYYKLRGGSPLSKFFLYFVAVSFMSLTVFNSGFRYQVCNRAIGTSA